MTIEIQPISSQPVSEKDIKSVETLCGLPLPPEYSDFLEIHNGGRVSSPEDAVFEFISVISGRKEESLVDVFFAIDEQDPYSVQWHLSELEDVIPKGFIPIACDPFGNIILISTTDSTGGQVYFWDHDHPSEDDAEPKVSFVAPTFTEFINSLHSEGF